MKLTNQRARQTAPGGLALDALWRNAVRAACLLVVGGVLLSGCSPAAGDPAPSGSVPPAVVPRDEAPAVPGPSGAADALQRRALADLEQFTQWLGSERGFIGEVGWPNEPDPRWNDLGDRWYSAADRSGLWVTAWAAGEWWGDYELAIYGNRGATLGAPLAPAAVLEAHPGGTGRDRGIAVNGGEFGIGANLGLGSGGTFSNVNRGTYDQTYHYDSQASFDFLATRGVEVVRIPFRWERIQPELGGPLDGAELARLGAAVDRAGSAGLDAVPTAMNYGAFWLHDETAGVGRRTPIGSPGLGAAELADLWRRLVTGLQGRSNVAAWGLMNEPTEVLGGAPAWERSAQAVVDAIRSTGDRRTVAVPTYNWSSASRVATTHPAGPWISDPVGNIVYEAHQYFDRNRSGEYRSYSEELAHAVGEGF